MYRWGVQGVEPRPSGLTMCDFASWTTFERISCTGILLGGCRANINFFFNFCCYLYRDPVTHPPADLVFAVQCSQKCDDLSASSSLVLRLQGAHHTWLSVLVFSQLSYCIALRCVYAKYNHTQGSIFLSHPLAQDRLTFSMFASW